MKRHCDLIHDIPLNLNTRKNFSKIRRYSEKQLSIEKLSRIVALKRLWDFSVKFQEKQLLTAVLQNTFADKLFKIPSKYMLESPYLSRFAYFQNVRKCFRTAILQNVPNRLTLNSQYPQILDGLISYLPFHAVIEPNNLFDFSLSNGQFKIRSVVSQS